MFGGIALAVIPPLSLTFAVPSCETEIRQRSPMSQATARFVLLLRFETAKGSHDVVRTVAHRTTLCAMTGSCERLSHWTKHLLSDL
jgi:hypothetical protein